MGSYISKNDLNNLEKNLNIDSLKFILTIFFKIILILFILKILKICLNPIYFKNYLSE